MRRITAQDIERLYDEQLPQWELLRRNYALLEQTQLRTIHVEGVAIRIQHNPARITSVTATKAVCSHRPCFLCDNNLPHEQLRLPYGNDYQILVNPYPIFPHHYTMPTLLHTPQRIDNGVDTMLCLARDCAPYTIFYNGAECGASAPMHKHFQIAQPRLLPIEEQWATAEGEVITSQGSAHLSLLTSLLRPVVLITAHEHGDAVALFTRLYRSLQATPQEEPMMNIIVRYEDNKWIILLFPRSKHRPACYYATDHTQRLVSPASVEMGGLIITPRQEDYEQLTAQEIKTIYNEISPSHDEIYHRLIKL